MKAARLSHRSDRRLRISVNGIVQGVGFRPFIYQLAHRHGVSGWVRNTDSGVVIEAEADERSLTDFLGGIRAEAPPAAVVTDVIAEPIPALGDTGFEIVHSADRTETRTGIPADIATCADCLADIASPDNRRYGYPFTNCTNCGPRFTIIESVPYDRPLTTMRAFKMCPDCRAEYENPLDRRFHAQPNACPVCGPHLSLDGEALGDDAIIRRAAELLNAGKVLAIKGLGGYHLACDARDSDAVLAMRTRKGRTGKPFAVMCRDLDEARRVCEVDSESEKLLLSPERPIVIMTARSDAGISPHVAPGNRTLGVMLPYTPLHHLLLALSPPTLVMTSGNLSEEPIAYQDDEAAKRLGHIADHFVAHDRPIHVCCDDSIARVYHGVPMVIRRARGYVPRPIQLAVEMPRILACGGDLKNTFCLTKGKLALLSQHLGDLENVPTMDRYREVVDHFQRFFDVTPEIIAHDMHPDYRSTRFAHSLGCDRLIEVQHHHAHIAACMIENGVSEPLIGVAFDGTGYGTDGRIWGGEFLIADFAGFERAAHLAYVPIPGGEAAIRRPRRMALAYLLHTFGPTNENTSMVPGLCADEVSAVALQVGRGLNAPLTSSMGRLFDAISALLGVCGEVTYEGQAAIELEAMSDGPTDESYSWRLADDCGRCAGIDVRPMIAEIVEDIRRGVAGSRISSRFHSTVADVAVRTCVRIRDERGLGKVALSGGVFQNSLLLGMTMERLMRSGFEVFRHCRVPCNDGGMSLGQAAVAAGRCAG